MASTLSQPDAPNDLCPCEFESTETSNTHLIMSSYEWLSLPGPRLKGKSIPEMAFRYPHLLYSPTMDEELRGKRVLLHQLTLVRHKASAVLLPLIEGRHSQVEYVADEGTGKLLFVQTVPHGREPFLTLNKVTRSDFFDLKEVMSRSWTSPKEHKLIVDYFREIAFGSSKSPSRPRCGAFFADDRRFFQNDPDDPLEPLYRQMPVLGDPRTIEGIGCIQAVDQMISD